MKRMAGVKNAVLVEWEFACQSVFSMEYYYYYILYSVFITGNYHGQRQFSPVKASCDTVHNAQAVSSLGGKSRVHRGDQRFLSEVTHDELLLESLCQ